MYELRYNDSDDLHRLYLAMAQSLTKHVRKEIMFTRKSLDTLLLGSTDSRTVLQRPAHCSNTDSQFASYIFHCYVVIFVHVVLNHAAKLGKYPLFCTFFVDLNQAKGMQTFAHKK